MNKKLGRKHDAILPSLIQHYGMQGNLKRKIALRVVGSSSKIGMVSGCGNKDEIHPRNKKHLGK